MIYKHSCEKSKSKSNKNNAPNYYMVNYLQVIHMKFYLFNISPNTTRLISIHKL